MRETIHQSGLAWPWGGTAARTRWGRRSVFVNTPSVSPQAAAGRTTSARAAVSVRKMSITTRCSRLFRACSQWARSGSETTVFSPQISMPKIFSPHCSRARTLVMPFSRSTATPQASRNFCWFAGSVTGWKPG